MRIFLPIFLLLLTVTARGQTAATWWYPLGSPEGTRQCLGRDTTTDEAELEVKWKTGDLRGSATILVGALASSTLRQQVVGLVGDTLVILNADGILRTRRDYSASFSGDYRLILGGLFDPTNGGPFSAGKPRFIGVGVERRSAGPSDSLWAFLADSAGNPVKQIKIPPPTASTEDNRLVVLIPITAYQATAREPAVLAIVTQPRFAPAGTDTLANGVVRFEIGGHNLFEVGRLIERYPIAPDPYPSHPALIFDPATLLRYVVVSTRTYSFSPPLTATPPPDPPVNGTSTATDRAVSIDLVDSGGRFRNVETLPLPAPPDPAVPATGRSYVATLYNSSSAGGDYFRVVTRDHSDNAPGTPSIVMKSAFTGGSQEFGTYADGAVRNVGWRIVTADLDGDVTNNGLPERQQYPNNFLDEVVAARQRDDDADITGNRLEIFRWNERDGNVLTRFASQRFDGRLLAAGDLVKDQFDRQELVIAAGDSVTILQMLPYKDPGFGELNEKFFRTIRTFHLGATVRSAAIADIDGDLGNDLIVVTDRATWAFGIRTPGSFGPPTPSAIDICRGDSLTLRWRRRIGGGEEGVDVILMGPVGDSTIASVRPSRPGPDSIRIATNNMREGTYRFRIADLGAPGIADTATPFRITAPAIFGVAGDGSEVRFGDRVTVRGRLHCVDDVLIQTSIGQNPWTIPEGSDVRIEDSTVTAGFDLVCGEEYRCGAARTVPLRARLVTPDGVVVSDTVTWLVPLPMRRITLEPGDTSRSRDRLITYSPADFACGQVAVRISQDGTTWRRLPPATRDSGRYTLTIPDEFSGEIRIRLCCESGADASCEYASATLEVSRLADGDYIAPNPFDPTAGEAGGRARIVYNLTIGGNVTVSIFDASRTLVRRIVDGENQESGRHIARWDGMNGEGRIVSNGAYICLIESSRGDRIVLPLYVLKKR